MVKMTEKSVDVNNYDEPFVSRDVQLVMENIQPQIAWTKGISMMNY